MFNCRDFLNIPTPASGGLNITKYICNKLLVVALIFCGRRGDIEVFVLQRSIKLVLL